MSHHQPKPKSSNTLLTAAIIVGMLVVAYMYYVSNLVVIAGLKMGDVYNIQADNGGYLTRYGNLIDGGKSDPTVSGAKWKIVKGSAPGTVNIVSDTGKYVSFCRSCVPGSTMEEQVLLSDSPTDWTPSTEGDGLYSFMYEGQFMARCYCAPFANVITAHATMPEEYAVFTVTPVAKK